MEPKNITIWVRFSNQSDGDAEEIEEVKIGKTISWLKKQVLQLFSIERLADIESVSLNDKVLINRDVITPEHDQLTFVIKLREKSLSAIEFKKPKELRISRHNVSGQHDGLTHEASIGIGQLIDYCARLQTVYGDCALSDFGTIIFLRYSKEKLFISGRYSLSYSYDNKKFSKGFKLLFSMWLNIKQLSSRPTFPWYGDYFKTSTILLEKSHCYYVLTNLLAETNCFVFRAYKLPSMDIVVIKIGCASY